MREEERGQDQKAEIVLSAGTAVEGTSAGPADERVGRHEVARVASLLAGRLEVLALGLEGLVDLLARVGVRLELGRKLLPAIDLRVTQSDLFNRKGARKSSAMSFCGDNSGDGGRDVLPARLEAVSAAPPRAAFALPAVCERVDILSSATSLSSSAVLSAFCFRSVRGKRFGMRSQSLTIGPG